MIANALLLAWALGWVALVHNHRGGLTDPMNVAAFACLVVFPALCVLAARHLP